MKQYFDNVPNIEAVRDLILRNIAAAQAATGAAPRTDVKIAPPIEDNSWIKPPA